MWAVLALGAAVLTSFNPILYKRMLRAADSLIVVWAVTLLALPLLALFTLALTPRFPRLDLVFALGVLGSAGLNAAAHLASARALQQAEASLVAPLLIFSPAFTVLLSAVFLDEIPSARGLLGVGLIVAGAYALNRSSGEGWLAPFRALARTPGVSLVLLAGLLWSITPLLEKTAIQHTQPENPRLAAFAVTALLVILLTPAVLARGRAAVRQLRPNRRDLVLAGLIAGTAPILGYTAYSLGFVGYVTALFRLSTLLTGVWSYLILGEQRAAHRIPGSLLMVAGAILVTT